MRCVVFAVSPFVFFERQVLFTENTEEKSALKNGKESFVKDLFDWLEVIAYSMIIVVMVFGFVFKVATIDGKSMNNTLYNGEKVFLNDFNYTPKQGDIVVISRNYDNDFVINFSDPFTQHKKPIIKRVIATEGQTVDIKDGKVYVDGKVLTEDYIKGTTYQRDSKVQFPLTVSKGCIFVMGDNREDSLDSRFSEIGNRGDGQIDITYVIGHAVFRIFPFSRIGGL